MKESEQLKILHLLVLLQAAIYASDECEPIKWFYTHETKAAAKLYVAKVNKEHSTVIKALWNARGANMPEVTLALDEFSKEFASIDYWKIPELTELFKLYKKGKLDHLLNGPDEN